MRRPLVSLVLAGGLLLALAAPVLGLDTGTSGAATLPDRFESKQGYLLLREEFPKESTEPVEIAVAGDVGGPAVEGALARLEEELARRPIFGEPDRGGERGGHGRPRHSPNRGNPDGKRAIAAVRELRSEVVPRAFAGVDAVVYVGGDTAEELDYHDTVDFGSRSCSCSCSGSASLAHAGVPLDRGARDGDRHEPALGRRGLRAARARLPRGDRQRAARPPRGRDDRRLGAASSSPSSSASRWTTRSSC